MTYSELYHSSIEISNYFTANYKNASKIALLLPNSIDMIKIINALTISPLEIILINFHLTNQEIINQLNQIDPSLLINMNPHFSLQRAGIILLCTVVVALAARQGNYG